MYELHLGKGKREGGKAKGRCGQGKHVNFKAFKQLFFFYFNSFFFGKPLKHLISTEQRI